MKVSGWISCSVLALGLFLLFLRTPFYSDDYLNTTEVYPQGLVQPECQLTWHQFFTEPEVFDNIRTGVIRHYKEDTGRFVTAVLLRVFSAVPRTSFALVGTLFFVLMSVCVCRLAGVKSSWFAAVFGFSVFTLLQEDAVVWLAGSMNYAWPVAWTLPFVLIFISGRMAESPCEWRNAWMWLFVPAMVVVAGGHEVVCAPLGAAVGVYWIRELIHTRRIRLSGRLLMTIGYAVGSCLVVFAPSSLARASGMKGGSLAYAVLSKVCTLGYGLLLNPWFYVIAVAIFVLWRKRHSGGVVLDSATNWCALVFLFEALMLLVFGNISPRAVWPFWVVSMVLALRLSRLAFNRNSRIACILPSVAMGLGVLTLVTSVGATEVKRTRLGEALSDWRNSELDVCVSPTSPDWVLGFVFDRSFSMGSAVLWGTSGYGGKWNRSLARIYGKEMLYGVTPAQAELLQRPDFKLSEDHKLPLEGDWYYYRDEECIVSPCSKAQRCGAFSAQLRTKKHTAVKRTEIFDVAVESIALRARKNFGSIGIFRTAQFSSAVIRDIIYATLYANLPFEGFVADFSSGRYIVLPCNRFRPIVCK